MSGAKKATYRGYCRLPIPREFTEEQLPTFDITTELLNTPENHRTLFDLFNRLYKCLHGVTISGPFGGSPDPKKHQKRLYTVVTIEAKNPKTMKVWYDKWRINYDIGTNLMCMSSIHSSHNWRVSYRQKSCRILEYWLNEIIYEKQKQILTQLVDDLAKISDKTIHTHLAYSMLLNDSLYMRYFIHDLPQAL